MNPLISELLERFPNLSLRPSTDGPALEAKDSHNQAVCQFLKQERGFDLLADLSGLDMGTSASPRFWVVYHLFSSQQHQRLRLVFPCTPEDALPSVAAIWPAADWHEREAYDFFGIRFLGHPNLKRILMWEGYPYYPLRKDFPLAGHAADLPAADVAERTGVCLQPAPLEGGPFVSPTGAASAPEREPHPR